MTIKLVETARCPVCNREVEVVGGALKPHAIRGVRFTSLNIDTPTSRTDVLNQKAIKGLSEEEIDCLSDDCAGSNLPVRPRGR